MDPINTMNIQELSNNIDQKVAQIDKQLATLQQKLSAASALDKGALDKSTVDKSVSEQLQKDVTALLQIKTKLQKSRSIMWQAHELQRGTDQKRLREKRWLGIALCTISGLGLLALLIVVLTGK